MDVEQPRGMQGSLHSQSDQSLSLSLSVSSSVKVFSGLPKHVREGWVGVWMRLKVWVVFNLNIVWSRSAFRLRVTHM